MRLLALLLAACSGGSQPDAGPAQCHIADKACHFDAGCSGVRLCSSLPAEECQRPMDVTGYGLEFPDLTGWSNKPAWCNARHAEHEGWCAP